MVHESKVTQRTRRWVVPLAAAASVALIGAIAWGASTLGGQPVGQQAPVAPAASSTSSSSPSASSSAATRAPSQVALPAYFVGANYGEHLVGAATPNEFGLYREFVKSDVPADATPAQKAKAAVAVAMNAKPLASIEPYVQPWLGQSVKDVTMTPSLITITLSGSSAPGYTSEQTRLAVQELVWTAQAAVGQGTIPVKFAVADGSTTLFGRYPTAQTYNRPAKDLQYEDLAPIWITAPERGHVFKTGTSVEVTGESCAFEATTQWELFTGGTTVNAGTTTATSGCPTRGTWKVDLGVLKPGDYSFRMFEASMKDGKVIAETSKPFTVT